MGWTHQKNETRFWILDPGEVRDVTLGRGQAGGVGYWRTFIDRLRGVGYDGILAIEHEDASMTQLEGVTESVRVLREILG